MNMKKRYVPPTRDVHDGVNVRFPDAHELFLRLPVGMRQDLKDAAQRNFRTLNHEICFRLAKSLEADQ